MEDEKYKKSRTTAMNVFFAFCLLKKLYFARTQFKNLIYTLHF